MKKESKRQLKGTAAAVLATSIALSSVPSGVFASTEGVSVTDSVYGSSSVTNSVYGTEASTPPVTVTNSVYANATEFTYVTRQFDNGEESYTFAVITGYTGASPSVVIPDTIDGYPVRWIDGAFLGNPNVTSVSIPPGVNKIFPDTFAGATNLQSVNIPDGVTAIEDGVFQNTSLTSIYVPSSVTSIGAGAFANTKLKNITVPSSVTSIGLQAFRGSYNLKSVVFENPNTVISDIIMTIPQQATLVAQSGSLVETYASANNLSFRDISTGGSVPDFDTGAQDPMSRYHRGEDVVVKDLFQSEVLAAEFASWMSASNSGPYGQATPVWSGTIDSTINKATVEGKIGTLHSVQGYVSFGNPSGNSGVTSLEGMQIFDKTVFTNPKIKKVLYLQQSSLTDVEPLSFLTDVYHLDLSASGINNYNGLRNLKTATTLRLLDNNATHVNGLSRLATVKDLILSGNKITDISGLSSLNTVNGVLGLSRNSLTNNNMPTLSALVSRANPNHVDISYNYLSQQDDSSEQFFADFAATGTSHIFSPQYNFVFDPVDTVKVEYRVKDTNELLGSDVYPYVESNTVNAKTFDGYGLEGSSFKTISVDNKVGGSQLTTAVKLKGINQPDPLTNLSPDFVDWSKVSYSISDTSVLNYDSASGKLNALASGVTGVDVLENGVYRGSYNINTNVSAGSPIVFYYNPVAPTEYTLTVQKVGNGTIYPSEGVHTYSANEYASLSSYNTDPGYEFEKWVIDGVDYFYTNPFSPSIPIKMDSNKVAVAHFKPVQQEKYQLSVSQEGEGSITPYDSGSSVDLPKSEQVNLTATPAEGYDFEKWVINGVTYTIPTVSIVMNANTAAKAYFNPQPVKVNNGSLTVEFRDVDSLAEIKNKMVFSNLPLGVNQFIADELIGAYKIIGDTMKQVILTAAEPFKTLTFFYKKEVEQPPVVPPTEPPVVEPPVVEPPVTEPPVVTPTEPPMEDPPVVQMPEPSSEPSPTDVSKPVDPPVEVPVEPQQEAPIQIVTPEPTPEPVIIIPTPKPEPKPEPTPVPVEQSTTSPVVVEAPTGQPEPVKPAATKSVPKAVMGTIFGIVKDSNGNPMANIRVELHSNPRATFTDTEGKYSFDNVELGRHTILLKNPVTGDESRIEVIVYKDHTDNASGVKTATLKDVPEAMQGVLLDEKANMQRIDFVIEPIERVEEPQLQPEPEVKPEPKPQPTPEPKEPEKVQPKKEIPVKPFLPLILLVLLPIFRRNVVVYNTQGLKLKKIRVKPKDETIIDLTGLAAEEFEIVFKRPSQFQNKSIRIKYGDKLSEAVTLQDDQNSINFSPEE